MWSVIVEVICCVSPRVEVEKKICLLCVQFRKSLGANT